MLPLNRLLARRSSVRRLLSAAHTIERAAGIRWAIRGSAAIGEALCPDLTGDLDLDVFAVAAPNDLSGTIAAVFEGVSLACRENGWELQHKPLGFRVNVSPTLSLDIGILCARGNRMYRVGLDGRFAETTDVLHRHYESAGSFQLEWMNLKLWAKTAMPWQVYPGSHIVRSLFSEAWKSSASRMAGWRGYRQRVKSLCDVVEAKDLIKTIERNATITPHTINALPRFLRLLCTYSDDLQHLSPQEHVTYVDRIRSRRRSFNVFISSRQREFAALRAVLSNRHHAHWRVMLAENFFPWTDSVSNGMEICDDYVDQADVFVGLYGESYGAPSPGRRGSPIEEELQRAMARLDPQRVVLFGLCGAEPEPELGRMLLEHTDGCLLPLHQDIDSAAGQIESAIDSAYVRPLRGVPVTGAGTSLSGSQGMSTQ